MAERPEASGGWRDNLPWETSSFVGRNREVAEIERQVRTQRLVTLSGTGGVGKTRLALRAARGVLGGFAHGVWLVDLTGLQDPRLVLQATARTLGVAERPDQPLAESVAGALHSREILLLLDNCEHVSTASAHVAELALRASPRSHVLATSRHPLGLPGEVVWRVPSLSLPQSGAPDGSSHQSIGRAVSGSEAVRLFVERAQAASPGFALSDENAQAVATICQQVDGIPLALEMAAARLRAFSVREVAERLDDRLRFLTAGSTAALPRHQTLRATLDWSYELLTLEERRLLRWLAIFAGGATFQAVEQVCGIGPLAAEDLADLLARLVDRSLVQVERQGDVSRYRLLETVRQYAAERLSADGEAPSARESHAAFFLALSEQAQRAIRGPVQATWLRRLEADADNLRAALTYLGGVGEDPTWRRLRMATALSRFWLYTGQLTEGRRWLDAALATAPTQEQVLTDRRDLVEILALALVGNGLIAFGQGAQDRAEELFSAMLDLASRADNPDGRAWAEHGLGRIDHVRGEYERAAARLNASLADFDLAGDVGGRAYSLFFLANGASFVGSYERAAELYGQSEAIFREIGDSWGLIWTLANRAHLDHLRADNLRSEQGYVEALELAYQLGALWVIDTCLRGLAMTASARGHAERAMRLFAVAEVLHESTGTTMPAPTRTIFERRLEQARVVLGPAQADRIWEEGRSLTTDAAVALALAPESTAPSATAAGGGAGMQRTGERPPDSPLSPRELEVAALVGRGMTNRQIAGALVVSERTVHTHVSTILRKLDRSTRSAVAVWAAERGLVPSSQTGTA